jgi:nitrogen regulatory protein PII
MDYRGLTAMKKIEIVTAGEHLRLVKDVLADAAVTGYTIIPNVSGMGHGGYHEGRLLFNEVSSLLMVITVVPSDAVDPILAGILPLFEQCSGVVFVTDTAVSRSSYFFPPPDSRT